ncbi:MAG: redox-regulated ATPase YchF [Chloroflexota bacterium]
MQTGIVGLPYSGKTTLFQTLTEAHLDAGALQKRETNQAIVKVPDERLDKLTAIFNPKRKINATVEVVDMVSMQKGDGGASSAFAGQFLAKVKINDVLIHVVRGFRDESVPHPDGSIDIMRDIRTLEDEYIFADLAFCENRIEKLQKDMMKAKSKDDAKREIEAVTRWKEQLEENLPLRDLEFSPEEMKYIKNYQPLTAKPMLIALNLDESDAANAEKLAEEVRSKLTGKNLLVEPFFAKIEMELSQLEEGEDKEMFMSEYGLTESTLSRMLRSIYQLLGLQSFFTVGEDETRAWTIRKGSTAQEAAGVIHTDFYNKFIRAEVVSLKDFFDAGSLVKCKEKGLFRLEGKEYIVADGDILNIRHG